ncbi:hypothetical protein MRX96_003319 [Rhipicephalus microplus]
MDGTTATGTANHRNRAQTQQHHLLIWQWNPNGIQGRKASLQQYIKQSTKRPDVIILQETHSETPPTLPGYRSFAKPPPVHEQLGKAQGRGVCTLVKKNLTSIDNELLPNGAIEHSTVEIVTGKRKRRESTFIINVYSNPKHFQQKFRTLVHKAQQLAGSNGGRAPTTAPHNIREQISRLTDTAVAMQARRNPKERQCPAAQQRLYWCHRKHDNTVCKCIPLCDYAANRKGRH